MQIAEICKKYEHAGDESFLKDIDDDSETVDYENLDGAMIVRQLLNRILENDNPTILQLSVPR